MALRAAEIVAIEDEKHGVGKPLEQADMPLIQRRAAAGDDIINAVLMAKDHVGVAFDDGEMPCLCDPVADDVERVQCVALGVEPRFWRVDVLGRLFVAREDPSAEANDAALFIANGEHQAATKAIVVTIGVLFADDQAALFDDRQFVALAPGPIDGVIPGLRRVAEAKEFHRFLGDAAFGQVIAGDLAGGIVGQGGLPALGDAELSGNVVDASLAESCEGGLAVPHR